MNQAYKRQAFKDGIKAAETYQATGDKSLMNAPFSMMDDESYELGMIWSRGFNFALVLAGICKMSAETELAVREYEPEYFATNLPAFPEAHRAAILERQRARLAATGNVGDMETVERLHGKDFAESLAVEQKNELPKGGGLLGATVRRIISDHRAEEVKRLATGKVKGEYFVVGNPQNLDEFQIYALTTGGRAAHTPLFKAADLPLVQTMTDALNDAYCAGILQGNRKREEPR